MKSAQLLSIFILLATSNAFSIASHFGTDLRIDFGNCDFQPLTLTVGESGIPLPIGYANETEANVTFIISVTSPGILGAEHEISRVTVPAHTGVHHSQGIFSAPIRYDTPVGTDIMDLIVRAEPPADNYTVCERPLTTILPLGLRELIQVPIRFCAIEGSPQADGKRGPTLDSGGKLVYSMASGANLLNLLKAGNDKIWLPNAHLVFVPARAPLGIPVIASPEPSQSYYPLGDLEPGNFNSHYARVAQECEQAWAQLYPNERGISVINARVLHGNGALGVTPEPTSLKVNRSRGDDLCGHPRNLKVTDITGMFVCMGDQNFISDTWVPGNGPCYPGSSFQVLGHELGHALCLGHGNGIDDDANGLMPPLMGPRRYDEYCDPGEREEVSSRGNLMHLVSDLTNLQLTDLQIETTREVAKIFPGARFDAVNDPAGVLLPDFPCTNAPCNSPPDVSILNTGIAETPGRQTTELFQTIEGPIPSLSTNQYLFFVDLDNNPTTGADPAILNFQTSFKGAELVASIVVKHISNGVEQVSSKLWKVQGANFYEIENFRIRASVSQQALSSSGEPLPTKLISIEMPDSVCGPLNNLVRLQAVAQQLYSTGALDRLPKFSNQGRVISLIPPSLPQCTVFPPGINPGATMTIMAQDLLPNRIAQVFLGQRLIATSPIDGMGEVHLNVAVPSNSKLGLRPVSVQVKATAMTAETAVLIVGPPLTPSTEASVSPPPDGAGWNRTDVLLTLEATNFPGGTSLSGITYSATGAQSMASTTISNNVATLNITAEGETVVTFYAVDKSGIKETPEEIIVRIDKTPPLVPCSTGVSVTATSPLGAVVHYTIPASSDNLTAVTMNCNPPPGSLFQIGTNLVICIGTDLAGNSNQCTFPVGIMYNTVNLNSAPACIPGTALVFDGQNDVTLIGSAAMPPPWTAELWVYRREAFDDSVILLGDEATALKLEQFANTRRVGFTEFGVADYLFNYIAPTNTWVHLAFVCGTNTRLYVNGALQDTLASTIYLPLRQIGGDIPNRFSNHFRGIVDEIRIWNVARNQDDIRSNMNRSLLPQTGLVAYWRFDEGMGLEARDASGYGRNGTLINGPVWTESTVPLFPCLSITRVNGNIILSWPTNSVGYTLQGILSLGSSGNWAPMVEAPIVVGHQYILTYGANGGMKFYRLKKP